MSSCKETYSLNGKEINRIWTNVCSFQHSWFLVDAVYNQSRYNNIKWIETKLKLTKLKNIKSFYFYQNYIAAKICGSSMFKLVKKLSSTSLYVFSLKLPNANLNSDYY